MTNQTSLLRLMSWLSPVFPTGGFSYSSGLEAAVATGLVRNQIELQEWLSGILAYGSMRNDAILFAAAWRNFSSAQDLHATAALGLALAGSAERYTEMTHQADAFLKAIRNWPETAEFELPNPCPLCVSVGACAGKSHIALRDALIAFLHSAISNQLQASIRLSVTGQVGATQILAALETEILALVESAANSTLDDLGSAAFNADIMAMKHEHMNARMFRS